MRPHTSPDVLLGRKSPTKERVRRVIRTALQGAGVIKKTDQARHAEDQSIHRLRIGNKARALGRSVGSEALAQGVELRAESKFTVFARGKKETPDHDMTRWSITVMSPKNATAQFEIAQSDTLPVPLSITVAEAGSGYRVYEPRELLPYQQDEMYLTAAALLWALCDKGERIVPSEALGRAEAG